MPAVPSRRRIRRPGWPSIRDLSRSMRATRLFAASAPSSSRSMRPRRGAGDHVQPALVVDSSTGSARRSIGRRLLVFEDLNGPTTLASRRSRSWPGRSPIGHSCSSASIDSRRRRREHPPRLAIPAADPAARGGGPPRAPDRAETGTVTTLLLGTGLPAPREVVEAVYERIGRHAAPYRGAARRVRRRARSTAGRSVTRTSRTRSRTPSSPGSGAVAGCPGGRPRRRGHRPLLRPRPCWPGSWTFRCRARRRPSRSSSTTGADPLGQSRGLLRLPPSAAPGRPVPHAPMRDRRQFHARAGEFGARLEGASEIHASLHYERAGLRDEAYEAAPAGRARRPGVGAPRGVRAYRRAVANMPDDLPGLNAADPRRATPTKRPRSRSTTSRRPG